MADCKHEDLESHIIVNHFEDSGGFMADVVIHCAVCRCPFQFLGLPLGLNLSGATMSADGQQARLAIAPAGRVLHPLEGLRGFSVKPA